MFAVQGASVYELLHDMLSGRQRPEDVEPLQVVVDEGGLHHIVRGHRRGFALSLLQGGWRHRTVRAPCLLYGPKDAEVAEQFLRKDTTLDGLALHLHGPPGKHPEAWHRGKPLFRTAQEWCDSLPEMPLQGLCASTEIGFNKAGSDRVIAQHTPVHISSVAQVEAGNQIGQRTSSTNVESLDQATKFAPLQWQAVQTSPVLKSAPQSSFDASETSKASDGLDGLDVDGDRVKPAMTDGLVDEEVPEKEELKFVCCMWLAGKCHYKRDHFLGKRLFLHEDIPGLQCGWGQTCRYKHYQDRKRHLVPDFSQLKPNMEIQVREACTGKLYLCTVLKVSQEKNKAQALVHYNGYASDYDEWVGADRIRSKLLAFHEPGLPTESLDQATERTPSRWQAVQASPELTSAPQSSFDLDETSNDLYGLDVPRDRVTAAAVKDAPVDEEALQCKEDSVDGWSESKFVCCMWLAGKCNRPGDHFHGHKHFLHQDIPGLQCGFGKNCWFGHYEREGGRVPDLSQLRMGVQVQVREASTGKLYLCTVLKVSEEKNKAQALVHYNGYASDYDEWVGADRIRSKLLAFHEPGLPTESLDQATERTPSRWQAVQASPGLTSAPQSSFDLDETSNDLYGLDVPRDRVTAAAVKDAPVDEEALQCKEDSVDGWSESKFVCCMWLAGKCNRPGDHFHGHKHFLHQDIPGLQCGFGKNCWFGHCEREGGRVPDLSQLRIGVQVQVREASTGKLYLCTVLKVSEEKNKAQALVHYNGYASDYDEWVGADRIRSKLLAFHEPGLPTESLDQAIERTPSRWQAVQAPPGLTRVVESCSPELEMQSVSQSADPLSGVATEPAEPSPAAALPWQEPDRETQAFDLALHATEEAKVQQAQAEQWQQQLEETLARVETEALRGVLEKHGWSGRRFDHAPELDRLLEAFKGFSSLREDNDSDSDSEPSIELSNDMESSCAAAPSDWEDRMARQSTTLKSLRELQGLLIYGTFRAIGGNDASKRGLALQEFFVELDPNSSVDSKG
eukprot:Skav231655  [mRNA]  locus=scaffold4482:207321:210741:- [translate_table: standard]